MENYRKGKNVEEPLEKDKIPIPGLPENFIWMQVNGGSKMRNLLGFAMKAFKDERAIVWSGSGAGLSKAVSCVEIMKREYKDVYQINKPHFRKVEEYWEPYFEALDSLVVVRDIPTIHILLSKDPLNADEPGYQAPMTAESIQERVPTPRKDSKPSSAPSRKHRSTRVLGQFTPKSSPSQKKSTSSGAKTPRSRENSENVERDL